MVKKVVDPARVTELAAQGLTQRDAAPHLGIKPSTLTNWFITNAEIRRAWDEGVTKFAAKTAIERALKQDRSDTEKDIINALRESERASRPELKRQTGLDYGAINNALNQLRVDGLVREDDRGPIAYYSLVGQ